MENPHKLAEDRVALSAEYALGRVRPQAMSYKSAVALFLEEKEKARRTSTVEAYKGLLTRLAFSGPLSEISGDEVRRKLKSRSNHNHYLVALKVFFNWCIKRRYITEDPTLGLGKQSTATRSRVLTDEEVAKLWKATEEPTTFNCIVRILILTGLRRNEAASIQFSWITQDTCTLPASITKNGKGHIFPLGALAATILTKTEPSAPDSLLFSARGSTTRPFSGWSKSKAALDKASGVTDWTLHDLRRQIPRLHHHH